MTATAAFEINAELINVTPQKTHGGSMRYVIGRKNKRKINPQIETMLDKEKKNKLDDLSSCLNFKKNCEDSKKRIIDSLKKFKEEGK